jgi:aspartate/methionine/tyrosine aminotransferase
MGYWESTALTGKIARHYASRYGVEINPQQIVLTNGASPALVLALLTAFPAGARIAMARPGYVAYRNTVKALHMIPLEIPCGPEVRFQLTARALAALEPAPAGLIVASPANPTGTILPPEELAALADVCRARNIRNLGQYRPSQR